jgi:multidrug efflux pump subunit AcrA (membrane-fusion protein)
MERMVEPGSKLGFNMDPEHSAHVARLYDPSKLQVRVDVPLADAAKVGVGQRAQIVVGVLPDRTFNGAITRVVNQADIQKNTLQVKVAIDDPSSELKPEMLARVRFLASAGADATTRQAQLVFAPENLIHKDGDPRHRMGRRSRRGGATNRRIGTSKQDGWVSIASGLQPGDQLIAGDVAHLHAGARINVVGESSDSTMSMEETKGGNHATHRMP